MEEFKPNSNKSKEEQVESAPEKKVEQVVEGAVRVKKSRVRKFTDIFIAEDIENVKTHILMDVLVPATKKALFDIVERGLDMLLYGGESRGGSDRGPAEKVSYREFYDSKNKSDDRYFRRPARTVYDYDDIELETRGKAEAVLARMDEIMARYNLVRVADFYDLVGETGSYTDNNYGWTNIRGAYIIRTRNGRYAIKLPRAVPID